MIEPQPSAVAGLVLAVLFAIAGTYVAYKAEELRKALDGHDGGSLMLIIARIISVTAFSTWIGVLRQGILTFFDPNTTVDVRVFLQALSSAIFLGVIIWAMVRVRSFSTESEDAASAKAQGVPSRFWLELERADQVLKGES